jgi:hypothetical protein
MDRPGLLAVYHVHVCPDVPSPRTFLAKHLHRRVSRPASSLGPALVDQRYFPVRCGDGDSALYRRREDWLAAALAAWGGWDNIVLLLDGCEYGGQ